MTEQEMFSMAGHILGNLIHYPVKKGSYYEKDVDYLVKVIKQLIESKE